MKRASEIKRANQIALKAAKTFPITDNPINNTPVQNILLQGCFLKLKIYQFKLNI